MENKRSSTVKRNEPDFDLQEWALKARISRENTHSRRFSASSYKSFRDEPNSFGSNLTICSTVSSPGYTLRDEIDPSIYPFTTALKALQAKNMYTWECRSPQDGGITLNSKWNEAEKYISNPLSGEVPLECLSAKTLTRSSFRRITISAPLIYPSHIHQHKLFQSKSLSIIENQENEVIITSQSERKKGSTRDVGTQSTSVDLGSRSPSPVLSTPSVEERRCIKVSNAEGGELLKSEQEVEDIKPNGEGQKMCPKRRSSNNSRCLSTLKDLWMRIIIKRNKRQAQTKPV